MKRRKPQAFPILLSICFFKGTARRSALAIAEQMDEIGGALNAYTTKEYTCFYARALDRHVGTAFDILCDMLTQPALLEKDLQTERGVILEELHMYEDSRRIFARIISMPVLARGYARLQHLGRAKNRFLPNSG